MGNMAVRRPAVGCITWLGVIVDYAICSMFSGRNTQACLSSSQTENLGAGNRGSADAPTGMAIVSS